MLFDNTDIVASYSRAEAIADGALIDVAKAAAEVGFIIPVALTQTVWSAYATWTEKDTDNHHTRLPESHPLDTQGYLRFKAAPSFNTPLERYMQGVN